MSSVVFHTVNIELPSFKRLLVRRFIKEIFISEEKILKRVDFIFCSDSYLLSLNQQFLKHNYYTDVLTFNNSNTTVIIGEIYISLDRVKENAITNFNAYHDELFRIIIHGVLHLCGHNDKDRLEKKKMTQTENFYLERFKTFHVETK